MYCAVEGDEESYVKGVYAASVDSNYEGDNIGGAIGYLGTYENHDNKTPIVTTLKNITVCGLTISGTRKVGGTVGQSNVTNWSTSRADVTFEDLIVTSCKISIDLSTITAEETESEEVQEAYAQENLAKLFAGAIIGESFYKADFKYCSASSSVYVTGYSTATVYQGDSEEDSANAGIFDGSRNNKICTIGDETSCSAQIEYIVTDGESKGESDDQNISSDSESGD